MASWMTDFPGLIQEGPFDMLEYFSGVARVSRLATAMGYLSRSFDLEYDRAPPGESVHAGRARRSAFDFNGEAGFLFPGEFNLLKTQECTLE